MTDWIPIRIQTEKRRQSYVKERIMGFPAEVMEKYFFQRLQSVTASGVDVMKHYIGASPGGYGDRAVHTDTGRERAAKGGPGPGRNKTGNMVDSVTWTGKKVSDIKYQFELGWLDGRPGYAIFQEQGTRNGVKAMESLTYTMEFMRRELRLLGTPSGGFRGTRASRWRFE